MCLQLKLNKRRRRKEPSTAEQKYVFWYLSPIKLSRVKSSRSNTWMKSSLTYDICLMIKLNGYGVVRIVLISRTKHARAKFSWFQMIWSTCCNGMRIYGLEKMLLINTVREWVSVCKTWYLPKCHFFRWIFSLRWIAHILCFTWWSE